MTGDSAIAPAALMPAPFARTSLPGRVVFGDGALGQLAAELDQRGLRQAMLMAAGRDGPLADRGTAALGDRVRLHWDEIRQHVPRELADRASAAATAAGADVLVTIGGGSTTGLGKAVAVATGLPLVVVPTTYAGSEMTPIYGLTSNNDKKTTRDRRALPAIVVYDPQLLVTLPPAVVGPSGMNALAHCAEALWAANADPVTDAIALDGVLRLREHLLAAYASDDAAARGQVLVAACLAGMALGTVGTSLHHALCHLLGGMFDAPHAETHAIVLPYVIGYLQPAVPEAARRLARAMDASEPTLAKSIWSLGQSVGTPAGLRSIGIREDQLPAVARAALAKPLPSPRALDYDGLLAALHAAWAGQPPQ
ncbi:MAG: maleylacetate reductase [Trebonia sp.]